MRAPRQPNATWKVVHSLDTLDPGRYLGELSELPPGEPRPGDWCDVVVSDSQGTMRWTLAVVESAPQRSIFAAHGVRRISGAPGLQGDTCRPTRREGEVAPLSPDFTPQEPAAGTDGKGSAAGSMRTRERGGIAPAA